MMFVCVGRLGVGVRSYLYVHIQGHSLYINGSDIVLGISIGYFLKIIIFTNFAWFINSVKFGQIYWYRKYPFTGTL